MTEGRLSRRPLIMIVEDDDDLRYILCETFDADGYEPLAYEDPTRALAAIGTGVVPAAIVLDFGLPGIGGGGFVDQLRASGLPASRCPVLLLTGWEHIDRLGLEVEAVMKKPADPIFLVSVIRALVAAPSRRGTMS